MPDPIALAEAGPVAILLVGIGALTIGFVRGWVVPGWLWRQERDQREKAETQAERNTDAIEAIAAAVKASLDARDRPGG